MLPQDIYQPGDEFLSRRGRRWRMLESRRRFQVVNSIGFANNLSEDTTVGYSGSIWSDCPEASLKADPSLGIVFEDDFASFPQRPFATGALQTTEGGLGGYKVRCATAGEWINDNMPHSATAGTRGGIISGLCDTDGDAMTLGTSGCPFLLTTTTKSKIWFEARVAMTSILTDIGQFFVGLGENAVTTWSSTIPLGNANATSNAIAMLGFNRLEDGLAVLNTSYADHATSWTDIQAAANASPLTQLVANTWIKLGMKIDMSNTLRCVKFYVNNLECTTAMTKAALLATTFLDVSGLGPMIAFYADTGGTANYIYLDKWKCIQQY